MTSTLIGAVISAGRVEAVYKYAAFGTEKQTTKAAGWTSAVTTAAAALLSATQAAAGDAGPVAQVQVYTPLTDPDGSPGFSLPGEMIDVTFRQGNSPAQVRVGDDEVVPTEMAVARDALKAAIEAEI